MYYTLKMRTDKKFLEDNICNFLLMYDMAICNGNIKNKKDFENRFSKIIDDVDNNLTIFVENGYLDETLSAKEKYDYSLTEKGWNAYKEMLQIFTTKRFIKDKNRKTREKELKMAEAGFNSMYSQR